MKKFSNITHILDDRGINEESKSIVLEKYTEHAAHFGAPPSKDLVSRWMVAQGFKQRHAHML